MKPSLSLAKGFSLIELLLVLAIVAALAVAAFVVYPRVQAATTASSEAKSIIGTQAAIRALFPTSDYRHLTKQMAIDGEFFPKGMNIAEGVIENRWGGAVDISPASALGARGSTSTAAPRRYFRIIYRQVPADVCIRLVGALAPYFGTVRISSSNGTSGDGIIVKDKFSANPVDFNETETAFRCKARPFNGETSAGVSITLVSN